VSFTPDEEIFGEYVFDPERIGKRLRELAFLNSGLEIDFVDHATEEVQVFKYDKGLIAFVRYMNEGSEVVPPIRFTSCEIRKVSFSRLPCSTTPATTTR
jgi:DNA gyrase subunit B